jgi:DNA polymerase-3 subunit delta
VASGQAAKSPASAAGLPWPELADENPDVLYGVFGEESFLVSQGLAEFMASPAFSQNPSLNVENFHASDIPPGRVLESARTLPFLGPRRLVLVQEIDLYKTAQLNEFVDYLKDPAPSTCLVFAGTKLTKTTKFAKALAKAGKVHEYKRMYPRQLVPWLGQRAQTRGKRLEKPAAEHLAELGGLGLGALDSELEKLSLYVGKKERIAKDDVRQVMGRGRLYGIFDFTDALAAGDLSRALTAYDQLDSLGEPAVKVLAMVTRLFRQLLEARAVLDSGGSQREVQQALRTPPSATNTLIKRARQENERQLTAHLEDILRTDVALKSSPGSDRVIVERLIMNLCGAGRKRG